MPFSLDRVCPVVKITRVSILRYGKYSTESLRMTVIIMELTVTNKRGISLVGRWIRREDVVEQHACASKTLASELLVVVRRNPHYTVQTCRGTGLGPSWRQVSPKSPRSLTPPLQ